MKLILGEENAAAFRSVIDISTCEKRRLYYYLRFYQVYPGIARSLTAQFQHLVPESLSSSDEKVRSVTALSMDHTSRIIEKLSYTHIEQFIVIAEDLKRTFYEIECSWYRKNMMTDGDNLPVGLLLCTQKDQALVEYALAGMDNPMFVSKYQLQLPRQEDIQRFLEASMGKTRQN